MPSTASYVKDNCSVSLRTRMSPGCRTSKSWSWFLWEATALPSEMLHQLWLRDRATTAEPPSWPTECHLQPGSTTVIHCCPGEAVNGHLGNLKLLLGLIFELIMSLVFNIPLCFYFSYLVLYPDNSRYLICILRSHASHAVKFFSCMKQQRAAKKFCRVLPLFEPSRSDGKDNQACIPPFRPRPAVQE